MTIRNNDLMQGLLIFSKYESPEGEVNPAYDQIYAGPEGEAAKNFTAEDIALLNRSGWFFDYDIERWYLG